MNNALRDLRQTLHQYPELSGKESQTADRIIQFAKDHHAPHSILDNIGGHSLALIYKFQKSGPSVMIRCELDALPIHEVNDVKYRSQVTNVSHKCGHDGHMAMVCGLILWLKENNLNQGRVILFFQSAEETGRGARMALEDERFKALSPDYVFALHNIPGLPMHQVIIQPRQFSPAVISLRIDLTGKVAHASSPETGVNPALAIAEMVSAFHKLNELDSTDRAFALLTPVHIDMGEPSYGISAGSGSIHYTIRAWSDDQLKLVQADIEKAVQTIAANHDLSAALDWFEYFPAAINDEMANNVLRSAVNVNNMSLREVDEPFRFGEDFGWFTTHWPCAMFGLGSGTSTPALHDEAYDFPDELILTGTLVFSRMLTSLLS